MTTTMQAAVSPTLGLAWFAEPGTLAMGAVAGLVFGFLLQKGGVTRFEVIVNQFRLKDFTVAKIMGAAVIVGGLGIWGMRAAGVLGADDMHVKSAAVLMQLIGGGVFAVGMVLLGLCPGTGVAALGSGNRDAPVGLVGMVAGAGAFAYASPWVDRQIGSVGDLGKLTFGDKLPLGVDAGLFLVLLVGLAAWAVFEHRRRGRAGRGTEPLPAA